ncbi:6436_t:CDS:2, partial [Diversispora eburnea]
MEYYHNELDMLDKAKVLDSVKKNLQNVANVNSGFDLERRIKAQELIDNWKSTIGAPPIAAESDMNKFNKKFIEDLYKLLNDNLNKKIRSEFQNIKGDVEKIRCQMEKIDSAVKSLEQKNNTEG